MYVSTHAVTRSTEDAAPGIVEVLNVMEGCTPEHISRANNIGLYSISHNEKHNSIQGQRECKRGFCYAR